MASHPAFDLLDVTAAYFSGMGATLCLLSLFRERSGVSASLYPFLLVPLLVWVALAFFIGPPRQIGESLVPLLLGQVVLLIQAMRISFPVTSNGQMITRFWWSCAASCLLPLISFSFFPAL